MNYCKYMKYFSLQTTSRNRIYLELLHTTKTTQTVNVFRYPNWHFSDHLNCWKEICPFIFWWSHSYLAKEICILLRPLTVASFNLQLHNRIAIVFYCLATGSRLKAVYYEAYGRNTYSVVVFSSLHLNPFLASYKCII